METTEKIVEAYVRYIRRWATIPNIKCPGQYEIDLLAINPQTDERYHIESGVSISAGFSKLTAEPFSGERLKERLQQSTQRRTLGYFVTRKFGAREVLSTLAGYGFRRGNYQRIIVTWGWTDDAKRSADKARVVLWDFRHLMGEIAEAIRSDRTYFTDDTLRTLHLYARSQK